MTKDTIRQGYYSRCGQYPLDMGKAMSLRSSIISLDALNTMKVCFDDVVTLFKTNGTLTETNLDQVGIANMNEQLYKGIPKDKHVLHHQRAVMLNAEATVEKFKVYNEKAAPVRAERKACNTFNQSIKHLPIDKQKQAKKKLSIEKRLQKLRNQLVELNGTNN